MTVGSLFAGIGGFDLGFERAGFEIKWQVEIDPYCQRILFKHWPYVDRWLDVRQFATNPDELIPAVDVICGGFPCQDISAAGKRVGIDGDRSGLWREFARVIGVFRPRYVVVENVAALLHRGIDRVLGDLAALGYDAEWSVVSACAVGAPHTRERVFIVAYPSGQRPRQLRWEWSQAEREAQRNLYWPESEPGHPRVVDGIPNRLDRLTALGNGISPVISEWIAHRIKEAEVGRAA